MFARHACEDNGTIVIIGSLAGSIPLAFQSMYCASKFAIEGYAEALRYEVMNFGIRVVLMQVGDVASPLTANRKFAQRQSKNSPYSHWSNPNLQAVEKLECAGQKPEIVARKVLQLINGRGSHRLRHRIARFHETAVLLLRWLGWWYLYDEIAKRAFCLNSRKT